MAPKMLSCCCEKEGLVRRAKSQKHPDARRARLARWTALIVLTADLVVAGRRARRVRHAELV